MITLVGVMVFAFLSPSPYSAVPKCRTIQEAISRVGEKVCVNGKVFSVEREPSGIHVLHFCEASVARCPFRVVVYPDDLRDVGDVRWMENKEIEIHGAIKEQHGAAEMVLRDIRQLRGEAAKMPLIPKQYDVESRGRFSAGRSQAPKHKYPRKPRKGDVEPQPAPGESGLPTPP